MESNVIPRRSSRYLELDGLRGVAIILVLVWHYVVCTVRTGFGTPSAYLLKMLSTTWSGVDLFFVLSGFLIGGILIDRGGPRVLPRFALRRAARLLPLYAVLMIFFAIGLLSEALRGLSTWNWLFVGNVPLGYYLTLTQNLAMASSGKTLGAPGMSPTWSLALEVQMYVFLAIILTQLPERLAVRTMIGLVCVAPVIRLMTLMAFSRGGGGGGLATYVLLTDRIDAPAAGVLVAYAARSVWARSMLESHTVKLWIGAGVALVAANLVGARGQGVGSLGMAIFGHTALAFGYAICVAMLVIGRAGALARVLRTRVLVYLGGISYFIYLFHEPSLGLWAATQGYLDPVITSLNDVFWVVAAFGCTVLAAAVSQRFFERPINRWAHRAC